MSKAVGDKFKLFLYVLAASGLVGFGAIAYQRYPRDSSTPAPDGSTDPSTLTETNKPALTAGNSRQMGQVLAYGGLAFLSLIGLGLLVARDVAQFLAAKTQDFIFNDDLKGVYNPEYEQAEQLLANDKPLEAIQMMRDYLKRHPREQYVALRIAEIYETSMGNYVASALEYEEILKKKLPTERWGWAAIHLANLYSGKLNKPNEATALLHRIVNEYGQTAAAKKARERLGMPEPVEVTVRRTPAPEPEPEPPPTLPPSNLPPGFRPKG